MTDTQISDERIERAALAIALTDCGAERFEKCARDNCPCRNDARTALETDAPALEAARAEGLREARKIASGLFGWDVDTWRDMTKKDMTRLMAEAIVAAIDARLSEMDRKPVNEGG